jgi:hypothetical protein
MLSKRRRNKLNAIFQHGCGISMDEEQRTGGGGEEG